MILNNRNELTKIVEEADLVLVGLGQEWMLTYEMILQELREKAPVLAQLIEKLSEENRQGELVQVMEGFFCRNYFPDRIKKAYAGLFKLVNEKNCFVISLCSDSYLKKIGFRQERIVNPCGNFEKMQCMMDCTGELYETEEKCQPVFDKLYELSQLDDCVGQNEIERFAQELREMTEKLICTNCKEKIVFNTLNALKYNENGYLEQWQTYMKWLQGTVNKKLCIIEAGVGLEMPSVIRWPFEKTAFYNQKATMIRIHHRFYQVNEEVSDRAYGIEENAVDFFSQD